MAQQLMDEQKANYKAVKSVLEKVSGQVLRISTPSLTLGAHSVVPDVPLSMAGDTGAERHVLCGKDSHHATNRRPLPEPIVLETANARQWSQSRQTSSAAACRFTDAFFVLLRHLV